jgi:hypothetical protein
VEYFHCLVTIEYCRLNIEYLRNSFHFKKDGAKRHPQIFNLQYSIFNSGLSGLGDSFYYVMGHIVKVANKRLLKTIGFAIRMPNYFPSGNGLLPRRLDKSASGGFPRKIEHSAWRLGQSV